MENGMIQIHFNFKLFNNNNNVFGNVSHEEVLTSKVLTKQEQNKKACKEGYEQHFY